MSANIFIPGFFNEVRTPFRFYDNIYKKEKSRQACKEHYQCGDNQCKNLLLVYPDKLLPFQVFRTAVTGDPITQLQVIKCDGTVAKTVANPQIEVEDYGDIEYITYLGNTSFFDPVLPEGNYYCTITDGTNTWYSEDFSVVCTDLSEQLVLNNSFNAGADNWTVITGTNATFTGGQLCVEHSGASPLIIEQTDVFDELNSYYKVVINFKSWVGGGQIFLIGGSRTFAGLTNGLSRTFYMKSVNTTELRFLVTGVVTACIADISVWRIIQAADNCNMQLRWYGNCNFIGNISYLNQYINKYIFPADVEIGDSEAKYTQIANENGLKQTIKRFTRRETTYRIDFGNVPRYLLEAFAEIPLHDNVYLKLPASAGGGESKLEDVEIESSWDDTGDGCFATVSMRFNLGNATVKAGCCDEEPFTPIEEVCTEEICEPTFAGTLEIAPNDQDITGGIVDIASAGGSFFTWDNTTKVQEVNDPIGDEHLRINYFQSLSNTYVFQFEIFDYVQGDNLMLKILAGVGEYTRADAHYSADGNYSLTIVGCEGGSTLLGLIWHGDPITTPIEMKVRNQRMYRWLTCWTIGGIVCKMDYNLDGIRLGDGGTLESNSLSLTSTFKVTIVVTDVTAGSVTVSVGGTTLGVISSPGTYEYTHTTGGTSEKLLLVGSSGSDIYIESASACKQA